MTSSIVVEQIVNAPLAKVWQALTSKDEMKQWYFDIAAFEPKEGFSFGFVGGDDKQSYVHLCKIIEVVPLHRLVHTWQYEGHEESTTVMWELSGERDMTRVKLTHTGLEKIAHHGPAFATANFEEGWKHIVGTALKKYVEETHA